MKLIFFTLALTTVILAQNADEELDKLAAQCGKELSIDDEVLEVIYSGEMRDSQESKCFFKCMYEKTGIINSKGEVQTGNFHEVVPKDDAIWKTVFKCQHIVVATCDDVLALEKCNDEAELQLNN